MKRACSVLAGLIAGCGGGTNEMFDPDTQYQLVVELVFQGSGAGYVDVATKSRCDVTPCSYSFPHSNLTEVPPAMLTAVPDPGSEFVGWSGDCSGTTTMVSVSAPSGTVLTCTATFKAGPIGPPMTFPTRPMPEGLGGFHIGANRPMGVPLLTAPGLADGTYVAVASGDPAGGFDLVHLETGVRKTNTTADVSPAYGITPYQGASGPLWVLFGAGGTATTGWDSSGMDFGGTGLGALQNTTQVVTADFDDDGLVEKVMVAAPNGTIFVSNRDGSNTALIDSTAYNGTAGTPVSAQFGRTVDEVLVVLVDGRVFFGPVAGAAGRLALVGTAGTAPRLAQCAGATSRICAIADYGGDMIHVVEIDGTGAHITASRAVGDAPIDPAIVLSGATARIAVTGSADNTFELLAYDPATDAITSEIARKTLTGCLAPNHVRLVGARALISCYGSAVIVTEPI